MFLLDVPIDVWYHCWCVSRRSIKLLILSDKGRSAWGCT